jgi:hypothetical protein
VGPAGQLWHLTLRRHDTPKDPEPPEQSFLCECGARFDSQDEYLKHRSAHEGKGDATVASSTHLTRKDIEKGEQGQTEEERREWQQVQRKEQM